MPACDKCSVIKEYLNEIKIKGEIYEISSDEGLEEFRKHYISIKDKTKRNEDGSLVVPVTLFFDEKEEITVANNIEEVKRIVENVPLSDVK